MTPLEELQAAHKRLSELRSRAQQGIWDHLGDFVLLDGGGKFVASGMGVANTDLIVTLHRTIDAQLAVLQRAMDWYVEEALAYIGPEDLALARAINGEAS